MNEISYDVKFIYRWPFSQREKGQPRVAHVLDFGKASGAMRAEFCADLFSHRVRVEPELLKGILVDTVF